MKIRQFDANGGWKTIAIEYDGINAAFMLITVNAAKQPELDKLTDIVEAEYTGPKHGAGWVDAHRLERQGIPVTYCDMPF